MYWLLGGTVYIVIVVSMVRFFQFVSNADRAMERFWIASARTKNNRKTLTSKARLGRDGKGIRHTFLPEIHARFDSNLT